jgi:hypothetical protein
MPGMSQKMLATMFPKAEKERQERLAREQNAEKHNEADRLKLIEEYEQEQRELREAAQAAEVVGESTGQTAHRGEVKAHWERPSNAYLARRNLRIRAYQDDQRIKAVAADAELKAEHDRRVAPELAKLDKRRAELEDRARGIRKRCEEELAALGLEFDKLTSERERLARPPEAAKQKEMMAV